MMTEIDIGIAYNNRDGLMPYALTIGRKPIAYANDLRQLEDKMRYDLCLADDLIKEILEEHETKKSKSYPRNRKIKKKLIEAAKLLRDCYDGLPVGTEMENLETWINDNLGVRLGEHEE